MTHCVDGGCPRANSDVPHGSDYDTPEGFCIAQHAEAGALLWSDRSLRSGGTIVVNGCPCLECARLIASSGISRVVCFSDDYAEVPLSFLKAAGVDVEVVEPYEQWVIETAIP
jgi:dCMP deaminase